MKGAQGHVRGGLLREQKLGLAACGLCCSRRHEPLGALHPLDRRQRGQGDAAALEGAELARRRLALRGRGKKEPQLSIRRGSLAETPGIAEGLRPGQTRARKIRQIRESIEDTAPEGRGPCLVARARGLLGSEDEGGGYGTAVGPLIGNLLGDQARVRGVAQAGQAIRVIERARSANSRAAVAQSAARWLWRAAAKRSRASGVRRTGAGPAAVDADARSATKRTHVTAVHARRISGVYRSVRSRAIRRV